MIFKKVKKLSEQTKWVKPKTTQDISVKRVVGNVVAEHKRQTNIVKMVARGDFIKPLVLAFDSLTGEFRAGAKRNIKKQFRAILKL